MTTTTAEPMTASERFKVGRDAVIEASRERWDAVHGAQPLTVRCARCDFSLAEGVDGTRADILEAQRAHISHHNRVDAQVNRADRTS